MIKKITNALKNSFNTIYPIIIIVFLINLIVPLNFLDLMNFLVSSVLIMLGITLFSFGSNISMISIGKYLGEALIRYKKVIIVLIVSFIIGLVVTVAEPDLILLASQLSNIPTFTFILIVGIGVGTFLLLATYRIMYKKSFNKFLIIFYSIIFLLILTVPKEFISIAFDASGATTGAISVPFIIAFGMGFVSNRDDKNSQVDTFGIVGLCSIGPIITVLLMGIFYKITNNYTFVLNNNTNTLLMFINALLKYGLDIIIAILPIFVAFVIFQLLTKKCSFKEIKKIILGLIVIIIGLTLFLSGANVGFLKIGYIIGNEIVLSNYNYLLIPIGAIIGFFIVQAEPSVNILTSQIENITVGSISKKVITFCLSIGVSLAILISLIRVTTGISILWFIIPGYFIIVILTLFIPKLFTVIAFDSGGAASGAMTTCFLLPLAIGASTALGGNIIEDAFGMVAMVAMSPLITVELFGLIYKIQKQQKIADIIIDESIIDYKWSDINV